MKIKTLEKITNEDFTFPVKALFYNNMEVAIKAYNQLLLQYDNLFSFKKSVTSKGHLLTLFIEKQFYDSSFTPRNLYTVNLKTVNKYKYEALLVYTEHFVLNIARTFKNVQLPSESQYKLELAKANKEFDQQLELSFIDSQTDIVQPHKYALLTYNVLHGDLSHLDVVIPCHDFKNILLRTDLLKDIKVYKNYVPEEIKEEAIVSLKKEMQKKVVK